MPEVRIIQPIAEQAKKQRVAAYARVSSDSADQLNSFATQVEYYTSTIQAADEWEFAGLYADEGVTGTRADKREDFQRLLRDCRAGKIDRILVKSISRFARNTLVCIQTVRELKQLGVAVVFEKEGIDTGSLGSEMLLSILGATAQEESLSISQNIKWSYQKRMRSGDFITCSAPLGYFLEGNTLVPDPQEVPIVKHIFASYLAGKSTKEIAAELNAKETSNNIKKRSHWRDRTVYYILTNEKYIGDSLVQKKYTPDELPLGRKKNHGEVTRYYISGTHQGIIDRQVFKAVQELLGLRNALHAPKAEVQHSPLSRKIVCGLCGSAFYHRHNKETNRWTCAAHLKDPALCSIGIIAEQDIRQAFLIVFNKLLDNPGILKTVLDQLLELQSKAFYTRPDIQDLNRKIAEIVGQNHTLARLQAKGCMDSASYIERCNQNNRKIEDLRSQLRKLQTPVAADSTIENTKCLIDALNGAEPMLEFEPVIFKSMIHKITVYPDRFCFHLINGLILDEGRRRS